MVLPKVGHNDLQSFGWLQSVNAFSLLQLKDIVVQPLFYSDPLELFKDIELESRDMFGLRLLLCSIRVN